MKSTKLGLTLGMGALFAFGAAYAADNVKKVETDRSVNPITGTVTDTRTERRKVTRPDGSQRDAEVEYKTKHYRDGSKKTEVDSNDVDETH